MGLPILVRRSQPCTWDSGRLSRPAVVLPLKTNSELLDENPQWTFARRDGGAMEVGVHSGAHFQLIRPDGSANHSISRCPNEIEML